MNDLGKSYAASLEMHEETTRLSVFGLILLRRKRGFSINHIANRQISTKRLWGLFGTTSETVVYRPLLMVTAEKDGYYVRVRDEVRETAQRVLQPLGETVHWSVI
jgi:hypothetical protein